jgi:hypothetical protein
MFLKMIFMLLPIVALVITLYYSNVIIKYFEDSVYNSVKEEKIAATKIFAQSIDNLVNDGFTWEAEGELYEGIIHLYIEMLDADDAVYAAVIRGDFEYYDDFSYYSASLNHFENEINKHLIMDAIEHNKTGYVEILLNGKPQTFYFHAIPLNNTQYWVLVSVDRDRIIKYLDLDRLRIPIFIIGLLLIIVAEDNIWQRIMKIKRL